MRNISITPDIVKLVQIFVNTFSNVWTSFNTLGFVVTCLLTFVLMYCFLFQVTLRLLVQVGNTELRNTEVSNIELRKIDEDYCGEEY